MNLNSFLLSVLLFGLVVQLMNAKEQSVTVTGQVICDKRSMRNVHIELREHDTLDPDDSLAETHSDKDGHFTIFGKEDEVGSIRPYIRITHNCDVKDRATCKRITDIEVPAEKVGEGNSYDMNFVNLNIRTAKDSETCT